jgi:hypothetical protein
VSSLNQFLKAHFLSGVPPNGLMSNCIGPKLLLLALINLLTCRQAFHTSEYQHLAVYVGMYVGKTYALILSALDCRLIIIMVRDY